MRRILPTITAVVISVFVVVVTIFHRTGIAATTAHEEDIFVFWEKVFEDL